MRCSGAAARRDSNPAPPHTYADSHADLAPCDTAAIGFVSAAEHADDADSVAAGDTGADRAARSSTTPGGGTAVTGASRCDTAGGSARGWRRRGDRLVDRGAAAAARRLAAAQARESELTRLIGRR